MPWQPYQSYLCNKCVTQYYIIGLQSRSCSSACMGEASCEQPGSQCLRTCVSEHIVFKSVNCVTVTIIFDKLQNLYQLLNTMFSIQIIVVLSH